METPKTEGQYAVKGGKTIIGKIFSYQEKTGMSIREIMEIPYILFVLGMLDAPCIDYDKKKEEIIVPKTAAEEIAAITGAFR